MNAGEVFVGVVTIGIIRYSGRLYRQELEKACHVSTWLGVGVAVFQGLSNLAINGVVLVVVGHGGLLLASNQISPGSLMAFLVATQTIQRSAEAKSHKG